MIIIIRIILAIPFMVFLILGFMLLFITDSKPIVKPIDNLLDWMLTISDIGYDDE